MDGYKQALLKDIGPDNFKAVIEAAATREAANAAAREAEHKALIAKKQHVNEYNADDEEEEEEDEAEDPVDDYDEPPVRRRRRGRRARCSRGYMGPRASYEGRRA